MDWTVVRQRGLALGLGAVLTLGACWGALWVILLMWAAGQPPDPTAPRGDPCCAVADTWGGTLVVAAATLLLALADAAALALGVALLVFGVRLRWPSRRLALLPPVVAGLCAVVISGALAVSAVV
jgi:hypothetical protein